ncbi:MAG: DUF6314 family protein [Silicimonas sp.]|jgi:hypothetical protein|nr:DUF6314 family protein [Silicimonas sp.]
MAGLASLGALVAVWQMEREIHHTAGAVNRMTGTCKFTRSGPRLLQDEEGWLETASGRFRATRRYVWTESGGRLDVYFEDMRPFHSVPLNVATPGAVHLCDPDRYEVAYDFTAWPNWRSTWRVEGPRKDYRMETTFRPDTGPGLLARNGDAVHKSSNA